MVNDREIRKRIASATSRVLRDSRLSKSAKVAAGSALSQRTTSSKAASNRAASAASRILRDSRYSKSAKTSAGLALTQKPDRGK
uniref:Uncharacterized protein n=1 Tax=Candidatus Kentrum sp. TUN TaxID=2126343 RepID=A0A450ZE08_9GAMM|nr:MAG: hypothetical protein BECKTUN1418D_GA0071000_101332 [Candidatus Kentron sp. TUN]VFK53553.1 MAG: hypothetical protein BECKTUN1418F_GA0071002_10243 [Candidatus Kentron sp. TUN]VFK54967.1 MAG: hypothetical protein BECKTUN1418E_GA0071001_10243 [Candidatus Kentron sp. TUN]